MSTIKADRSISNLLRKQSTNSRISHVRTASFDAARSAARLERRLSHQGRLQGDEHSEEGDEIHIPPTQPILVTRSGRTKIWQAEEPDAASMSHPDDATSSTVTPENVRTRRGMAGRGNSHGRHVPDQAESPDDNLQD
eukprot:6656781-Prymnesium_polylepis.1